MRASALIHYKSWPCRKWFDTIKDYTFYERKVTTISLLVAYSFLRKWVNIVANINLDGPIKLKSVRNEYDVWREYNANWWMQPEGGQRFFWKRGAGRHFYMTRTR